MCVGGGGGGGQRGRGEGGIVSSIAVPHWFFLLSCTCIRLSSPMKGRLPREVMEMPLLVARVQATDDSNFYTNKDLPKNNFF